MLFRAEFETFDGGGYSLAEIPDLAADASPEKCGRELDTGDQMLLPKRQNGRLHRLALGTASGGAIKLSRLRASSPGNLHQG